MANFAIGDVVNKDKGRTGTVRAIFTTMAGELCYAVEHEGAVDFVEEAKLSDSPKTDLAALDLNAFVGSGLPIAEPAYTSVSLKGRAGTAFMMPQGSLMGHRALGLAAHHPPCCLPLSAQPAGVCFWDPGVETHALV